MKNEAASAGVLDTPFGKFARLQLLTIEDLFAGKKSAMPPEDPAAFKRATGSLLFHRGTCPSTSALVPTTDLHQRCPEQPVMTQAV